jgi:hypothetical protein
MGTAAMMHACLNGCTYVPCRTTIKQIPNLHLWSVRILISECGPSVVVSLICLESPGGEFSYDLAKLARDGNRIVHIQGPARVPFLFGTGRGCAGPGQWPDLGSSRLKCSPGKSLPAAQR